MSKWKEILEKCTGSKLKKENMLIFILLGILLFIIALPTGKKKEEKSVLKDSKSEIINQQETNDLEISGLEESAYVDYLEEKLEHTLSSMEGVGKSKVMVTVSMSKKEVVEKDMVTVRSNTVETDSEGGSRNINNLESTENALYTTDSNGNQIPFVTQVLEPEITGVIVVAQGAGRENVNSDITEAIQALFGIEAHKIKIAKMKTE